MRNGAWKKIMECDRHIGGDQGLDTSIHYGGRACCWYEDRVVGLQDLFCWSWRYLQTSKSGLCKKRKWHRGEGTRLQLIRSWVNLKSWQNSKMIRCRAIRRQFHPHQPASSSVVWFQVLHSNISQQTRIVRHIQISGQQTFQLHNITLWAKVGMKRKQKGVGGLECEHKEESWWKKGRGAGYNRSMLAVSKQESRWEGPAGQWAWPAAHVFQMDAGCSCVSPQNLDLEISWWQSGNSSPKQLAIDLRSIGHVTRCTLVGYHVACSCQHGPNNGLRFFFFFGG